MQPNGDKHPGVINPSDCSISQCNELPYYQPYKLHRVEPNILIIKSGKSGQLCIPVYSVLTLSDPESEDTEEADECCWGLEMDMGEYALWGELESLCGSSTAMQPAGASDILSLVRQPGEKETLWTSWQHNAHKPQIDLS